MATRVVATGRAIVTNLITGAGTTPDYIGWGTGTTEVADGDTALQTASAESRVQGTATRQTTTTTNDTFRVVGTLTASATRAITEAGLFDAITSGAMYLRSVFPVINLSSGDAIQFTFDTEFTSTTT